jgi:hypothetical protein
MLDDTRFTMFVSRRYQGVLNRSIVASPTWEAPHSADTPRSSLLHQVVGWWQQQIFNQCGLPRLSFTRLHVKYSPC